MNKQDFLRVFRCATVCIAVVLPLQSSQACDDTRGTVVCDPTPSWSASIPNQGSVIIGEEYLGDTNFFGKPIKTKFMLARFLWISNSDLAWYKTQQWPTVEVEATVIPSELDVRDVVTVDDIDLPFEGQFVNYQVVPCRYKDTRLGDAFTSKGVSVVTVGSACAASFKTKQLYYALATLSGSFGKLETFRFQPGRWAPEDFYTFKTENTCKNAAQEVLEKQTDFGLAKNCVFSCVTCWPNQEGTYPVVRPENDQLHDLPGCWEWRFENDPSQFAKCRESKCDDGIDNDYDGLVDCDDPDCSKHSVCANCSYSVAAYACPAYSPAAGPSGDPGQSGGEVMKVCGAVNSVTGAVVMKSRKYDGSAFGERPYAVRVSNPVPVDGECLPGNIFKAYEDVPPQGVGSSELTFSFDSIWKTDQTSKAYCVTAATKLGDDGYDPNDTSQKSWWWSKKVVVHQECAQP